MKFTWDGITFIRVEANGIAFEVATLGGDPRENAPLAICLHGFPEHAYSWRHQMPMLAELGYRVWAPNLRGYGNTDQPSGLRAYALDTLVEDVAALIRASGARTALVLAHDWGGMLGWLLAMRHPELVQHFIVCNMPHPACFAQEARHPPQLFLSWYVLLFQIPGLPEWLLGARGAAAVGDMFQRSTRDRSRFPKEVLAVYRWNASRPGRLTAMLNWYRAFVRGGGWRSLPREGQWLAIQAPTLLLWGEADTALSVRTTDDTAAYVRDFTLHVLPGVSHWIQQEAPEAVNALIVAWLQNQCARVKTSVPMANDGAPR